MEPIFFKNRIAFRKWLAKNHSTEKEVIVGFYKISSGKPSMIWEESVEEALCYGWIDGVRRGYSDEAYTMRFTPRKPKSIWSLINKNKVEKLIKEGLMTPAGLAAFEHGKKHGQVDKAYSLKGDHNPPEDLEKALKKNKKSWEYFQSLANSNKHAYIAHMSVKNPELRKEKIRRIVKLCSMGIKPYEDGKKSVMRENI